MRPEDPDEGRYVDVRLVAAGPDRVATVRVVRDVCGVGIAEASALVARCPVRLLDEVARDRGEAAVARLAAVGAVARLE